jgi:hypothetical protein
MRRATYTCAAASLLMVMSGCRDPVPEDSPFINSAYDETADFSLFGSFDLVEPGTISGPPEGDDPDAEDPDAEDPGPPPSLLEVNRVAIRQAIIHEFEARGYVRDTESPDVELTFFVRLEDAGATVPGAAWSSFFWGSYWDYGFPWFTDDVIETEAGTLIVDAVIADPRTPAGDPPARTNRLIFRGVATALLPSQPTDISDHIPAVIEEMFEDWPIAGTNR